jgi:hypothetical protein
MIVDCNYLLDYYTFSKTVGHDMQLCVVREISRIIWYAVIHTHTSGKTVSQI